MTQIKGDNFLQMRRFSRALRSVRIGLSDTLGLMEPESVFLLAFAGRCYGICSLGRFYLGLFLLSMRLKDQK